VAHHTVKSSYAKLTERLNKFPQGAPPSQLLFRILEMLMSEREAELLSLLPIRPFTAEKAARNWKMDPAAAHRILDTLAGRALLVDIERRGRTYYTLPPPMAGFFEFSLMRTRGDLDQKVLSELFYQYLNVEEDFIKALFTEGETRLGRVFVQEPVLSGENALHVLDYERATEVIKTASQIGIGLCYCRHKKEHLGQACDAPLDICMTFNGSAESLIRHGHVRAVEAAECLDLLEQAYEIGLVQFGETSVSRTCTRFTPPTSSRRWRRLTAPGVASASAPARSKPCLWSQPTTRGIPRKRRRCWTRTSASAAASACELVQRKTSPCAHGQSASLHPRTRLSGTC
jgi:hypothetical protein